MKTTNQEPFTAQQVIANLKMFETQLAEFPKNLTGGAGWVRNAAADMVERGISGLNPEAVRRALDALKDMSDYIPAETDYFKKCGELQTAARVALAALKGTK